MDQYRVENQVLDRPLQNVQGHKVNRVTPQIVSERV